MMMATGAKAQEMLVRLADNRLVRYDVSQVQYVTFWETAFVVLELPSGTLWATCNLGAAMQSSSLLPALATINITTMRAKCAVTGRVQ